MTALVGNAIGAKDTAEASKTAMQGIGFAIVASALRRYALRTTIY